MNALHDSALFDTSTGTRLARRIAAAIRDVALVLDQYGNALLKPREAYDRLRQLWSGLRDDGASLYAYNRRVDQHQMVGQVMSTDVYVMLEREQARAVAAVSDSSRLTKAIAKMQEQSEWIDVDLPSHASLEANAWGLTLYMGGQDICDCGDQLEARRIAWEVMGCTPKAS